MSCGLPVVEADVIRSRLAARARAERIPLQVEMEIIATCNYKCVHCYIAPCAERGDMMTLEQARGIFRKLVDAGTMGLLLTGGEIFTHREFREIYLAAKRSGFAVHLNSNGYYITDRWADFFVEWPPEIISLSMYGATRETYEGVTGIPSSFDRFVRNVDGLLARGIRIDLKCPAMTVTAPELPLMKAFADARGVNFRSDFNIMPEEKGGTAPLQLMLAPRDHIDLLKQMDPGLEETRKYSEARINNPMTNEVYLCGAGRTGFAINVFGGVTTCLTSRKVVGNIIEQPFEEVWAALGGKVAVKYPDNHPCATCRFHSICAGCPATVESLTGLPEGYVQQYCQMSHLRAYELGYHPTGIPRTVKDGIPEGIRTPARSASRMLPMVTV
jgi:radical SAM protein with 4Fe4S-binding SPASM domain